jgi:hypothetical protein
MATPPDLQLNIRVTHELKERLDRYVAAERARTGYRHGRSEVARWILERFLDKVDPGSAAAAPIAKAARPTKKPAPTGSPLLVRMVRALEGGHVTTAELAAELKLSGQQVVRNWRSRSAVPEAHQAALDAALRKRGI